MAQRDAAYWAAASALATWLAVFVGLGSLAVSVYAIRLVRAQLIMNREAVEGANAGARAAAEAARAANAESRPWIRLEMAEPVMRLTRQGRSLSCNVSIKWTNVGRTPAIEVWPQAEVLFHNPQTREYQSAFERLTQNHTFGRSTLFPGDEFRIGLGQQVALPEGDRLIHDIYILFVIKYRAYLDGPILATPMVVRGYSDPVPAPAPYTTPPSIIPDDGKEILLAANSNWSVGLSPR